MGFNFSVRKLVDGELKFESGDYGIDTIRCVGDEEFYDMLINSEDGCTVNVLSNITEDCIFVRPKNFSKARMLAKKIINEESGGNPNNTKRLLTIIDKLEADPSLWLGGGR